MIGQEMSDGLTVRPYRDGDAEALVLIFFASVRQLARVKYSEEQVRAWAPGVPDPSVWEARMGSNETFVAECNGREVGFIELERDGHLCMLHRSPNDSGQGVAEMLYQAVEARAYELKIPRIFTEASHMAESFFAAHGYVVDGRESAEREGVLLPRARMSKMLRFF